MHAIFTNLMAGLLFVQAAFGCCWQHVHVWDQSESVALSQSCCKHDGCQGQGGGQHPTKPCKLECQGICTYLRAEKVQFDSSQVVIAPFDFVAVTPTLTGNQLFAVLLWELAGGPADLEPPLRLHLLHQILLI